MKRILGSLIYLAATALWGAEAPYFFKAAVSKQQLFTHEPAVLTVSFYKHREINTLRGQFRPQNKGAVRYEAFEKRSETEGAYDIEHYVYLLRFEQSGSFTLPVTAHIQRFNQEEMIEASNRRDAMDATASSVEKVAAGTLEFTVEAAPADVPVGNVAMSILPGEEAVLKNEPAHFSIRIEGEGDIREFAFPSVAIDGVTLFVEEGERKRWIEDGKLHGSKVNHYAAVARADFTVPGLNLRTFSPADKAERLLATGDYAVTVRTDSAFEKALLDEEEAGAMTAPWVSGEALVRWGLYLLLFASGFAAAKLRFRLPRRTRRDPWIDALEKAREQKEILMLLLPRIDDPVCRRHVEALESGPLDARALADVKKELLLAIKSAKSC